MFCVRDELERVRNYANRRNRRYIKVTQILSDSAVKLRPSGRRYKAQTA